MTKEQILALINQFIIENLNEEITANVLNPILKAILNQPNDLIGVLEQSNVSGLTVVDKLNTLLSSINDIKQIQILVGDNDPNVVAPPSYGVGDFYNRLVGGQTLELYQFNGNEWVLIENLINDDVISQTQTWSSDKILEVINSKNEFLYVSSLSLVGNVIKVGANSRWRINNNEYSNQNEQTIIVRYSAAGSIRIDNLIGTTLNTIVVQEGTETIGIAIPNPVPTNAALLTMLTVSQQNIVIDNNEYKRKSESNFNSKGADGPIEVFEVDNDRSNLILTRGNMLYSINFTQKAELYAGKEYSIINNSGNNILIRHNFGSGNCKFSFINNSNYVLKVGEIATFYLTSSLNTLSLKSTSIPRVKRTFELNIPALDVRYLEANIGKIQTKFTSYTYFSVNQFTDFDAVTSLIGPPEIIAPYKCRVSGVSGLNPAIDACVYSAIGSSNIYTPIYKFSLKLTPDSNYNIIDYNSIIEPAARLKLAFLSKIANTGGYGCLTIYFEEVI